MWVGISLSTLLALLFLVLGIVIRAGNIFLIHEFHRKNVSEENRLDYGKAFARGLFAIAIGCFASDIFLYFRITWMVLISLLGGIIIGVIFFNIAQKKYNGGWYS